MKLRKMTQNIEPSMCGGDAALCRITLTTCYYCLRRCRGCDDVLLVEAVWEWQLHETVTTGVGVCSRRGSSSHHPPPSLHTTTTWRHNHRITDSPRRCTELGQELCHVLRHCVTVLSHVTSQVILSTACCRPYVILDNWPVVTFGHRFCNWIKDNRDWPVGV